MFDPDWTDTDDFYDEEFSIVDSLTEFENNITLDNTPDLGLSLGFGDFISDERLKTISNLTENTDRENMKAAIKLVPVNQYKKQEKLQSLEKLVNDLCKGRISIDDEDY